ncbi:hypothetical protein, partial [Helicobacter typhlonius]|uniref:hypothetical protein n=1 Tax=Helicobacter typhlonius TaxID=76936 RepID=UPI002FE0390D
DKYTTTKVIDRPEDEKYVVCYTDKVIEDGKFTEEFEKELYSGGFSGVGIYMGNIMNTLNMHYADENKGKYHPKYLEYKKKCRKWGFTQ